MPSIPRDKMIVSIIQTMNSIRRMCRDDLLSAQEVQQYTTMFYKCSDEKLVEIHMTLNRTGSKAYSSLEGAAKTIVKRGNYLREQEDRKRDQNSALSGLRF